MTKLVNRWYFKTCVCVYVRVGVCVGVIQGKTHTTPQCQKQRHSSSKGFSGLIIKNSLYDTLKRFPGQAQGHVPLNPVHRCKATSANSTPARGTVRRCLKTNKNLAFSSIRVAYAHNTNAKEVKAEGCCKFKQSQPKLPFEALS